MAVNEKQSVLCITFKGQKRLSLPDRKPLLSFFKKFGDVKKLYINPTGRFGTVYYNSETEVQEALKSAADVPPYHLALAIGASSSRYSELASSSTSNSVCTMDDCEVFEAAGEVMYDVYGNAVVVYSDDSGKQYVPYQQISRAGYKLYSQQEIRNVLMDKEYLLDEFNLYMLTKARKFMLENNVDVPEETIQDTVDYCRQMIFKSSSDPVNMSFTIKNNSHPTTKLQEPHTNFKTNAIKLEPKKFGYNDSVTLKNALQKVVVTHVVDNYTCYVTPCDNIEQRDSFLQELSKVARSGNKAEPIKNLVYACNIQNVWQRGKIISTQNGSAEAFLLDKGGKAVVKQVKTLPKRFLEVPAQVVLLKFNSEVRLSQGMTIEVNVVQKSHQGYEVELRKQEETKLEEQPKAATNKSDKPDLQLQTKNGPQKPTHTEEKEPTQTHENPAISQPPVRKSIIDKVGSTGIFCCSELVDTETFVAYVMSTDCSDDLTLLEEINNCKPDPSFTPQIGDVVAVRKTDEKETWVRGLVVEKRANNFCCALVDYGVTQVCEEARKLEAKFLNIPDFSCVCKTDAQSVREIETGKDQVTFTVISRNLLELKLNETVYKVCADRWDPVPKLPKTYRAPPLLPPPQNGDLVRVKDIDQQNQRLFLETKQCNARRKQIESHITSHTFQPLTAPPQVNQLVLAPWEDEGIFRGAVKTVQAESVEVYFLDYGNTDSIALSELRNVDEVLAALEPTLTVSLPFWYLEENELSQEVMDYLVTNAKEVYEVVHVEGKFDLRCADGVLLSKKLADTDGKPEEPSQSSTSSSSLKEPFPKPDSTTASSLSLPCTFQPNRTSSPSIAICGTTNPPSTETVSTSPFNKKFTYHDLKQVEVPPGRHKCMCMHVGSLLEGILTFTLLDRKSTADLQKLKEAIDCYVAKESSASDVEKDELCIALFEGEWYRGVVLEKDGDNYTVFYVDYGNTSCVTSAEIKSISADLLEVPATALICHLEGLNEDNITETILSELNAVISEGVSYDIEILEKNNSDDSYVIRMNEVDDVMRRHLK